MVRPADLPVELDRSVDQQGASASAEPDVDLELVAFARAAPLRDASSPRKAAVVLIVCTAQFLNIALLSSLCESPIVPP